MRNKAVVVVAIIGVLTASVAFILGIITGANNAGGARIQLTLKQSWWRVRLLA
jgi:hypothetical protein